MWRWKIVKWRKDMTRWKIHACGLAWIQAWNHEYGAVAPSSRFKVECWKQISINNSKCKQQRLNQIKMCKNSHYTLLWERGKNSRKHTPVDWRDWVTVKQRELWSEVIFGGLAGHAYTVMGATEEVPGDFITLTRQQDWDNCSPAIFCTPLLLSICCCLK